MTQSPKVLAFVALAMPLLYYVCFHYGWNNNVHNWWWVCAGWTAAGAYGALHARYEPTEGPHYNVRVAIFSAIYLLMIFSLSVFTILEGWGMTPRNWWLVVIPYCFAAALPPFNTVSEKLLFWRPQRKPDPLQHIYIDWLTSACVEALNALEFGDEEERMNAVKYIREQLDAVGNPVFRESLEDHINHRPEQG